MNEYLKSIQSLDSAGTGVQEQILTDITSILEMSGEAPSLTYIEPPVFTEEISQDSVSYSAPQKVIVRKYRLRK